MLVTTRPAEMVVEHAKQRQMNKRCVQSLAILLSLGIFVSLRLEVVEDVLGPVLLGCVQKYIK